MRVLIWYKIPASTCNAILVQHFVLVYHFMILYDFYCIKNMICSKAMITFIWSVKRQIFGVPTYLTKCSFDFSRWNSIQNRDFSVKSFSLWILCYVVLDKSNQIKLSRIVVLKIDFTANFLFNWIWHFSISNDV